MTGHTPQTSPSHPSRSQPHYVGRFAPSPTGPLHLGSLVAALGSWLLARQAGGEWLIRIEDLDPPREVPGAAENQLATLARFGLLSDRAIVHQSARHALYRDALDRLRAAGLVFDCSCSRSDLAETAGIHRHCHDTTTQSRAPAQQTRQRAVRLRVADGSVVCFDDLVHGRLCEDVATTAGDVVLLRADGYWAYQLAVVVDDAQQGVTDVVRGADLLDSTPRQILLQHALGLPTPRYAHLPLIVDADGRKLSKSLASCPVDGDDPVSALGIAWAVLGQNARALPTQGRIESILMQAVTVFDPAAVPKQSHRLAASQHA